MAKTHPYQQVLFQYVLMRASGSVSDPPGVFRFLPARHFRGAHLRDAQRRPRDGFTEYQFPLPQGFPPYQATTLLTPDRYLITANVAGKELTPAQGYLIRPWTFDVGNVATKGLVVALPSDAQANTQIDVAVALDPVVRDVWRNESDSVGLDYQAPSDGWMLLRNPYESGWEASVNGMNKPVLMANGTWMAVQVAKGLNKVLLEYKPAHSWNRTRILVNAYVYVVPMLGFFLLGFTVWKPKP
jgi:hypothetical protein